MRNVNSLMMTMLEISDLTRMELHCTAGELAKIKAVLEPMNIARWNT